MNTKSSSESHEVITIDVLKANDLLVNSDYRYLDVRTEEEFKKGHVDVKDVINIPNMFNTSDGRVKNPNFLEQVLPLFTKDDHLVVLSRFVGLNFSTSGIKSQGYVGFLKLGRLTGVREFLGILSLGGSWKTSRLSFVSGFKKSDYLEYKACSFMLCDLECLTNILILCLILKASNQSLRKSLSLNLELS
ncbi:thiosulfate sulfurtransferase 18-like protein [Tanacetum coccineum]